MYVYVQVASLRLMTTRVRELVNIPLQLAFFPDQSDKHEAIERARRVQRMRALVLSGMRKLRRVQVMRGALSEGGSETEGEAASPSFPQFLYHAQAHPRDLRKPWQRPCAPARAWIGRHACCERCVPNLAVRLARSARMGVATLDEPHAHQAAENRSDPCIDINTVTTGQ